MKSNLLRYEKARNRYSIGRTVTDAKIIVEQEKEIERYREQLNDLNKVNLELKLDKAVPVLRPGDHFTVKTENGEFKLKLVVVIYHVHEFGDTVTLECMPLSE